MIGKVIQKSGRVMTVLHPDCQIIFTNIDTTPFEVNDDVNTSVEDNKFNATKIAIILDTPVT